MKRYENYSPEMPVKEDVPAADTVERPKSTPKGRPVKRGRTKGDKPKEKETKPKTDAQEVKEIWQSFIGFWTSTSTRVIIGLILCSLGIYLGVACLSYFAECVKDQASIANAALGAATDIGNAGGEGGARLSEFLINESFGLGSLVIIIWLICVSLNLLLGHPKFKFVNFTVKCLVALITVSLIIGLLTLGLNSPVNWGGYHGRYVNEFLIHFLGWTGAVILCLLSVAIFIVI
ncbi:MAG: DNA translocase FtsK 4TM domain-containing protein, partial [Muribaculaceae bacterium]|nr:DNA translocase FtsK 4TM domain-containing protein [Muribaculaceae bacterium]